MKVMQTWIDKADSQVRKKLLGYNLSQAAGELTDETKTVEICITDDRGEMMAGITASIFWKQMHVDFLWVDESLRRSGKGSELLAMAEEIARDHQCRFIQLTTFSFQAPAFYNKKGYSVFGILEDAPYDGAKQYFFKKNLN